MDPQSIMDKKVSTRGSLPLSKGAQEPPAKDVKKNGRRRESDKSDNGRRLASTKGPKPSQRYVRPREKTSEQVMGESGSLYHGRKKQNITHLMDWWGERPPKTPPHSGGATRHKRTCIPKYNKEHYLQAHCQFVVVTGEDYSVYENDPDSLVQWSLVEEVRLHMSAAPHCPICLHPPIAAKVTRCGHIYCYSCMLHYLALSDDKWRKCPICDSEVIMEDLKSVVCEVHCDYQAGETITLQLIRRDRDSLMAVPLNQYNPGMNIVSRLNNYPSLPPYCKLAIASPTEVVEHICGREENELQYQMATEGDQPEACFIQQALDLLQERRHHLNAFLPLGALSLEDSPQSETVGSIQYDDKNGNSKENKGSASVTADDLDISQLQPNASNQGQPCQGGKQGSPKPTFYFYQCTNGAHMYLHAINVQMLVHEYGSLDLCPPTIQGKILEKESACMTEELRNRLRYLRHLPLSCSFEVVEINLGEPTISSNTINEFQFKMESRRKKRNKKAKEERKIERRVLAEEEKLFGRSKGIKMSLQSDRHFPSFTEETIQSLSSPSESEIDVLLATSPSASVDSETSIPSFAQMIRENPQTKENDGEVGGWPSLGGSGGLQLSTSWGTQMPSTRSRTTTECSDDTLEDNMAAAPEFKQTFSDAFAIALDAAAKKAQDKHEKMPDNSKGKKKKRRKGILLMSSGGF